MACFAKSQSLYIEMTMLKVDSAYSWSILSITTAGLCYTQPLNKISSNFHLDVQHIAIEHVENDIQSKVSCITDKLVYPYEFDADP